MGRGWGDRRAPCGSEELKKGNKEPKSQGMAKEPLEIVSGKAKKGSLLGRLLTGNLLEL